MTDTLAGTYRQDAIFTFLHVKRLTVESGSTSDQVLARRVRP